MVDLVEFSKNDLSHHDDWVIAIPGVWVHGLRNLFGSRISGQNPDRTPSWRCSKYDRVNPAECTESRDLQHHDDSLISVLGIWSLWINGSL